jgi:hypothetical protein
MAKKENKTKSFILRIDSDTMDAIEKWAADEFRSTNGQLQWIISEALRKNRRLPKKRPSSVPDEAGAAAGQAPETEKEE